MTGFLGSHTTIQLLNKGYKVVGSLRDLNRTDAIRQVIGKHTDQLENLSLVEADLNKPETWEPLMEGIEFVQHIASPFPRTLPKREEELIRPAKEGTLAILEAAAKAGVKRLVLTSSSGVILYGKTKGKRNGVFTEETWTDPTNIQDTTPYFRSKTIAEKAAWAFLERDASQLELTTLYPGAILGPVLEQDYGTSANIIIKMLNGSMPAIPRIGFDFVDVREVADLQIRAMELPEAANQRFIGSAGFLTFMEVVDILREAYPDKRLPSRVLPDFMTRLISMVEPTLRPIFIDLGGRREVDAFKARQQLNWEPSTLREAVLACAESVVNLGLVK